MNQASFMLSTWRRMSEKPGGKWLFSRLVCWKAPYFGSVRPRFAALRPGYAEARMKKRRAVLNHIGTVHAIAMCNLAELVGGTMTDVSIPSTHRWIPKGMTVEYMKKAETDVTAAAALIEPPQFEAARELPVDVVVRDSNNQTVMRAVITMWVSPRK